MPSLRCRVSLCLEPSHPGPGYHRINILIIALVMVCVAVASALTIPTLSAPWRGVLMVMQWGLGGLFLAEYLLRLWVAPEHHVSRRHYAMSLPAIIDALALLPFLLLGISELALTSLVLIRLLRLLRYTRYFEALGILMAAVRAEFYAMAAAFAVLLVLLMLAATGIHLFEHQLQPEVFGSIPQSMWWAIVTLTTLGYGDAVPISTAGKLFASLITLLSIGAVALPTSILASRFTEELRNRKVAYQQLVVDTVRRSKGRLDRRRLERVRQAHGITPIESDTIIDEVCHEAGGICPMCKQELDHAP
ncbi:potassium channel family protein [Vibrio parahaemolyticus]